MADRVKTENRGSGSAQRTQTTGPRAAARRFTGRIEPFPTILKAGQYSTMLYYEAVYGKQRANGILNAVFVQTHQALRSAGRDMPAGLPASDYPSGLYVDIVYDKGALYFHELRERVGDDAFFETLQTYYERHRYQIATTESFLHTVEDVTGDRHLDLYEMWIKGDDEPS